MGEEFDIQKDFLEVEPFRQMFCDLDRAFSLNEDFCKEKLEQARAEQEERIRRWNMFTRFEIMDVE